jgi:hypothetical protein
VPIPPHSQHKEREPWCAKCNEIAAVIKRYEQAQHTSPRQPSARAHDPETSHDAAATKDETSMWYAITEDVRANGPGTEETILERIGVEQRTNASSCFARLVQAGWIANLIDPRTRKTLKLRNKSTKFAMVRGLPEHQKDRSLIDSLCAQMDRERE